MELSEGAEIYLDAIKQQAVRTLGLLDREQYSRTFGCMDRTFWAWKFTDFSGARFQEDQNMIKPRKLLIAGFSGWCINGKCNCRTLLIKHQIGLYSGPVFE